MKRSEQYGHASGALSVTATHSAGWPVAPPPACQRARRSDFQSKQWQRRTSSAPATARPHANNAGGRTKCIRIGKWWAACLAEGPSGRAGRRRAEPRTPWRLRLGRPPVRDGERSLASSTQPHGGIHSFRFGRGMRRRVGAAARPARAQRHSSYPGDRSPPSQSAKSCSTSMTGTSWTILSALLRWRLATEASIGCVSARGAARRAYGGVELGARRRPSSAQPSSRRQGTRSCTRSARADRHSSKTVATASTLRGASPSLGRRASQAPARQSAHPVRDRLHKAHGGRGRSPD